MHYKRDLLKETKKSKFRIAIGNGFFVFSILWVYTKTMDSQPIKFFDWLYVSLFSLNGIVHILGGLGYSIESYFGKAFIEIDEELLNFKLGIFEKQQKVSWRDIESIDYKQSVFKIHKRDNTTETLKISKLDYLSISQIKEAVSKLADDKGIRFSIT